MSTIKQLAREFWLPFALALGWTIFVLYGAADERNLAGFFKTFGPTFFLISWASGQFVRVSRQSRTDATLKSVERRIAAMIDAAEAASEKLIATMTGGHSYAYLQLANATDSWAHPAIIHQGDFALYDLSLRMCNLERVEEAMQAGESPDVADHWITIGELAPRTASTAAPFPIDGSRRDWNIFFFARNGLWTQQLRYRHDGSEWLHASIVTKTDGAISQVVRIDVDHRFPLIGEPAFDEAERNTVPVP